MVVTEPLFEDLDQPLLRFTARGRTYPRRETLRSWAWYWNEDRQLWVNENEVSEDSPSIEVIACLPGIEVVCEGPVE